MEKQPAASGPEQWVDSRIEGTGLRPRDAAYIIAAFWAVAVIVFGVLERIMDPRTYHIWLGMRWAVATVTTIGYGESVPDQTAGAGLATAGSGAWPVGYTNVRHWV